ncbi:MAG: hypothetical protein GYB53_20285 [Rhodobacteraceae bacterium]|nr:hypothetical protein [Paracoccaceae bacterium]MBR9823169.1 hypothetical protein [Paracoccaceae bacterium]
MLRFYDPNTGEYLLAVLLASLAVALVVSLLFGLYLRVAGEEAGPWKGWRAEARLWLRLFLAASVLALIGGMAGQLGGSARETVTGDLVPAVFSLAGGYGAYLLGEKKAASYFTVANGLSFVFAFFLLYNLASVWRQENERTDFCLTLFADPDFDSVTLLKYREAMFTRYCEGPLRAVPRAVKAEPGPS